jgi:hypothetical protein
MHWDRHGMIDTYSATTAINPFLGHPLPLPLAANSHINKAISKKTVESTAPTTTHLSSSPNAVDATNLLNVKLSLRKMGN